MKKNTEKKGTSKVKTVELEILELENRLSPATKTCTGGEVDGVYYANTGAEC